MSRHSRTPRRQPFGGPQMLATNAQIANHVNVVRCSRGAGPLPGRRLAVRSQLVSAHRGPFPDLHQTNAFLPQGKVLAFDGKSVPAEGVDEEPWRPRVASDHGRWCES